MVQKTTVHLQSQKIAVNVLMISESASVSVVGYTSGQHITMLSFELKTVPFPMNLPILSSKFE